MGDIVWQVLTGVVIIAIMFILVRPGSNAGQAITDTTGAVAALIRTTVGSAPNSAQGVRFHD